MTIVSVKVMALVYDIRLGCALRKAVALKLADCSDDAGRNIWPAVETIADKAEISPRSVQNKLGELVAAGLIRIVRAGGGRNNPTHYEFVMPVLYALAEGRETFAARLEKGASDAPFHGDGYAAANGAAPAPFAGETPQETTRNPAPGAPEPSGTIDPPKSPKGGPSGKIGDEEGENHGENLATIVADLRGAGRHLDAIENFVAPLVGSGKRLSIGRTRAAQRAALAEIAGKAHGITAPALAAAVRRIVDAAGKATLAVLARELATARAAGEMVPIRRGSPEWSAWLAHFKATDPKLAGLMQRYDGWQVPRRWPNGTPAQGATP